MRAGGVRGVEPSLSWLPLPPRLLQLIRRGNVSCALWGRQWGLWALFAGAGRDRECVRAATGGGGGPGGPGGKCRAGPGRWVRPAALVTCPSVCGAVTVTRHGAGPQAAARCGWCAEVPRTVSRGSGRVSLRTQRGGEPAAGPPAAGRGGGFALRRGKL